jgi:hypothetical protein
MADSVDPYITLKLNKPIELIYKNASGDERVEQITELRFREEATGADFLVLDPSKGEMGALVAFTARMCDQPIKVIEKLKGVDFWAALEVVKPFLPNAPQTLTGS